MPRLRTRRGDHRAGWAGRDPCVGRAAIPSRLVVLQSRRGGPLSGAGLTTRFPSQTDNLSLMPAKWRSGTRPCPTRDFCPPRHARYLGAAACRRINTGIATSTVLDRYGHFRGPRAGSARLNTNMPVAVISSLPGQPHWAPKQLVERQLTRLAASESYRSTDVRLSSVVMVNDVWAVHTILSREGR